MTVNTGSTSLKIEIYNLEAKHHAVSQPVEPIESSNAEVADAETILSQYLTKSIDVVGHRIVLANDEMPAVRHFDDALLEKVTVIAHDTPLHSLMALQMVEIVGRLQPRIPQYAVSDSAFHQTLSAAASTYAIPQAMTQSGLRRIGYHGLSHEYAAHRAAMLAEIDVTNAKIVTVHLGGGSSICAVQNGFSIDTTMGYTPLDGLPMATRSGSVDPGILLHLLRNGMPIEELDRVLEHTSGLLGISNLSGDARELLAAKENADARLALDVLTWRTRAAIGSLIANLGGIDLITFTGGIGEHSSEIRRRILEGGLGVHACLDEQRNAASAGGMIQSAQSRVQVCVVPAREGWQIARAVAENCVDR